MVAFGDKTLDTEVSDKSACLDPVEEVSDKSCKKSDSTLDTASKSTEDQISNGAINISEDINSEVTILDKLAEAAETNEKEDDSGICELVDSSETVRAVELLSEKTANNDTHSESGEFVESVDKLVDDVLVVIDETTSKDTIKKSIESDSKELVDTGGKPNVDSVKDDCLEICGDSRQVDQEERAQSEEA